MRARDVVAVTLPPGPDWARVTAAVWEVGAALLPLDHRLPEHQTRSVIERARPTIQRTREGWSRRNDGVGADDDVSLVIATSGTAGAPKLVEFERAAVEAAVWGSVGALGAGPRDPWLSCLPLAHVGGLLVVLRGIMLGAPLTVLPNFDIGRFAAAGCRFTSIVPTMLVRLLDGAVDLAGFRGILVGAGGMPPDLRARASAAGAPVVQTYGLTESCGGIVYDGRPFAGVQLRIHPETSAIELFGPTAMRGYRFDERGTAEAFTSDGWLRTADAGRLERDGTLHVLGRLDDLVKTGGERVWPEEVEAALRGHPKVADVAVAGRPDPEWGQRVVAFVVPVDPAEPPTLEELRDHAAGTLPSYGLPREIVLVPGPLPRSASGKIRRAALR